MEMIQQMDFAVLDFIQAAIKNAILDPVMLVLSYVGEIGAIWIVFGIIMLFFRKKRATGLMILVSLALFGLIGELALKHLIARPRPFYINTDITLNIVAPSGYSFPSGHSGTSFAAALVIAFREKRWMGISAYALAVLIAFSRLYNYVHYPTDVLAGILLGTLCGAVTLFVFKKTGWARRISG